MANATETHWRQVYATKAANTVSWFQETPAPSLAMLAATGLGPEAALIDVGAGASRLIDTLLDRGFRRLTVLDVSAEGLAVAQTRLGARAGLVTWIVADITTWTPPAAAFNLWHDRAALHFLVKDEDRQAYVQALRSGLRPGGYAILATFALTGPKRCSGLPVRHYSDASLQAALGEGFRFLEARPEMHRTPDGTTQDFVWRLFQRVEA